MLRKLDLSHVRKLLCDDDSSSNSIKKLSNLRFIPLAIVERWRSAEGVDEVSHDGTSMRYSSSCNNNYRVIYQLPSDCVSSRGSYEILHAFKLLPAPGCER